MFSFRFSSYEWVRLAIAVFALALGLWLRARAKGNKRKLRAVSLPILVFMAAFLIFGRLPFENLFVTYPSPQSALRYMGEYGEIGGLVNGKASSLVIYSQTVNANKDDELRIYVEGLLPKTEKGWKIAEKSVLPASADSIEQNYGEYRITLARPKHGAVKDYYVIVYHFHEIGGATEVSDSAGSDFHKFVGTEGYHKGTSWWYAYIEQLDENYELIIDGEPVKIDNLHGWLEASGQKGH